MNSRMDFGRMFRQYRRNARDRVNGGPLSQARLADLLSEQCGIVYSRAAISDWERGKGHIHKDDRTVLVGIIQVLHNQGGLNGLEQANTLLTAGNYRALSTDEASQINRAWTEQLQRQTTHGFERIPAMPSHQVIGRERALEALKSQLLGGQNVALSAINGLPGVGKTTLALMLAHDHQIRERFSDGVLWVGIGRRPDTYHLLGRWAKQLGIADQDLDKMGALKLRANAIHEVIARRKLLLVIDDVWDERDVALFKLGGVNCTHILTTRQPQIATTFAKNSVHRVTELNRDGAFELLRHLAPQVVDADRNIAYDIVKKTGGLPLALVLTGNHLRIMSQTGRKRRLYQTIEALKSAETRLNVFAYQPIIDGERHPSLLEDEVISLQSIIGSSVGVISTVAQRVLVTLQLFPPKPNSFTEEAALQIAATTPDVLDELFDHGLLESAENERYCLHQSIHDFAAAAPCDAVSKERFIRYFAIELINRLDENQAYLNEVDNILAALFLANQSTDADLLWELFEPLYPKLVESGHIDLARETLTNLSGLEMSIVIQSRVWRMLGQLAFAQSDYELATQYVQRGIELARKGGDSAECVAQLVLFSSISSNQSKHEQAETLLQEALYLAGQSDDWNEVYRINSALGRSKLMNGHYREAVPHFNHALQLAQTYDLYSDASLQHNLIGIANERQGLLDDADESYRVGLQIARKHRLTTRTMQIIVNIGALQIRQERFRDAIVYLQEGVELARSQSDLGLEAAMLNDIAAAHIQLGEPSLAEPLLIESMRAAQAINENKLVTHIAQRQGEVALALGKVKEAKQHFEHSLAFASTSRYQFLRQFHSHFGLAKVATENGDNEKASHHVSEAFNATKAGQLADVLRKDLVDWCDKLDIRTV